MNKYAICAHPENPHYFLFRSAPTVLITSAEHYGSVVNLDFAYVPYLDVLAAYGLNATRIYAGAYLEPEHYFIHDNSLGPREGRHCLPWGRSEVPGFPLGGNLLDLDQWNPEYFRRLRDFIGQAGRRGIVVEICFFNAMYTDLWPKMPLYHANNIQRVGSGSCRDFQTLKDSALVARQSDYVRRITREISEFDNVILEICDEPGISGTPQEEYRPWLEHLLQVARDADEEMAGAGRGLRHMIAQQMHAPIGGPGDLSGDPRVSVIVGQYVGPIDGGQLGAVQLLDGNYGHNKPVEFNETAYYPIWYEGDKAAASRVEAWEFILGGGASFNQLNGLYTTSNSSAANTGNEPILQSLQALQRFVGGLDIVRMRRDTTLFASPPDGAFARAISEPGRQYALYLHHSRCMNARYVVCPGSYRQELLLHVPAGRYQADWINPADGQQLHTETVEPKKTGRESLLSLQTPPYTVDIALRLLRL